MDSPNGCQFEDLHNSAMKVDRVAGDSAGSYRALSPLLVKRVNHLMVKRDDLNFLIGSNHLELMFDNHKHHAATLAAVFVLGKHGLLARTLPWVYHSYHARGFSFDYFPAQFACWRVAVRETLPPGHADDVLRVYKWMEDMHPLVTSLATNGQELSGSTASLSEQARAFRDHALRGEHCHCLGMAVQIAERRHGMQELYLDVIQPAMRDIGRKWARGNVTVAEEHLASAVVGRVMTQLSLQAFESAPFKGRAIIATPPGEAHEFGAWMMSDLLEREGWDVRNLGANTRASSLLRLTRDFKPSLLAFSVTVPIHFPALREMIRSLREALGAETPAILVGGTAFQGVEDVWKELGADGHARNPEEVLFLAETREGACQKNLKD